LENKAEEAGKNSNKRIADHYTFYKGGLNLKLEELFEGVDYEIISGDPFKREDGGYTGIGQSLFGNLQPKVQDEQTFSKRCNRLLYGIPLAGKCEGIGKPHRAFNGNQQ
jgi:hypothetical protein